MSLLSWLEHLFVPASTEGKEGASMEQGGLNFEWNQNNRIVLAVIIVIISAICMWWIVA